MNEELKTAIKVATAEAIGILTTSSIAKVELDVPGGPSVKVLAYWCGTVLRIDIKGLKKA